MTNSSKVVHLVRAERRVCRACGKEKDDFRSPGPKAKCRACRDVAIEKWKSNNGWDGQAYHASWRDKNHTRTLLRNAKGRAAKLGLPFTLVLSDIFIPEFCPVLGIKLEMRHEGSGRCKSSPTLDRMIPELGYVRGNVAVISGRANSIKNVGTAEEHERVAAWMRATVKKEE